MCGRIQSETNFKSKAFTTNGSRDLKNPSQMLRSRILDCQLSSDRYEIKDKFVESFKTMENNLFLNELKRIQTV